MGGNTPSSGYVGVYLAMQMCSKVAVYGFGVNEVGGEKVTYHYYTGYAARKVLGPHPRSTLAGTSETPGNSGWEGSRGCAVRAREVR